MKQYIVAMVNMERPADPRFKELHTGKLYTRMEAMAKAEELNKTCQGELKAFDYDSFVAYSVYTD